MVRVIQTQLSETFPSNADLYQTNGETPVTQPTQLDTWIQQQVDTVPESQRVLVSAHDALGYYADAYNLHLEAALASFSTNIRLSAADLRELIDFVKDSNVISESPIYADSLGEAGPPAVTPKGCSLPTPALSWTALAVDVVKPLPRAC